MSKAKRFCMGKLKEVLRLKWEEKKGNREVGRIVGINHKTVGIYLKKAEEAGVSSLKQIEALTDSELKELLFQRNASKAEYPDYDYIHNEMKKKGVTLKLLWAEFKEKKNNPCGYTLFCDHYRSWKKHLGASFRQTHKAGEKAFIDYAGQTVPITNRETGEIKNAQIFIMVLGASSYSYVEATWTQQLHDWISSHVRAFSFFKGIPEILVPDNLRSAISKTCRYEPDINSTYHDMAKHYNTVVIPARTLKPKDKAKAETGVRVVEMWILAALRNRTFFSLDELNEEIKALLVKLNTTPFQKMNGCRESVYLDIEKRELKPLPPYRYEMADWKKAKVNIDYHIELEKNYYSVHYKLIHKSTRIRYTSRTVEIFHDGKRVASHPRLSGKGKYSTLPEHMPKSHKEYLAWTPSRITQWASVSGPYTEELVEKIMALREHPEQGFRSCMGVMRLGKQYGDDRLELACKRAIKIGGTSYHSIKSILEKGLELHPLPDEDTSEPIDHDNIRGPEYYQ